MTAKDLKPYNVYKVKIKGTEIFKKIIIVPSYYYDIHYIELTAIHERSNPNFDKDFEIVKNLTEEKQDETT